MLPFHHHRSQINIFVQTAGSSSSLARCHLCDTPPGRQQSRAEEQFRLPAAALVVPFPIKAAILYLPGAVEKPCSGPADVHFNKVIYHSGDINYSSCSEQKCKLLQWPPVTRRLFATTPTAARINYKTWPSYSLRKEMCHSMCIYAPYIERL